MWLGLGVFPNRRPSGVSSGRTLVLGSSGDEYGYVAGQYGSLTPAEIQGVAVERLVANRANANVITNAAFSAADENTPPDGYGIGFDQLPWRSVAGSPNYWEVNVALASGRCFLTYDVGQAVLLAGARYRLSWELTNLSPTSSYAACLSAAGPDVDLILVGYDRAIAPAQVKRVSALLDVTGPAPSYVMRVGVGTTTVSDGLGFEVRLPELVTEDVIEVQMAGGANVGPTVEVATSAGGVVCTWVPGDSLYRSNSTPIAALFQAGGTIGVSLS